MIKNTNKAFKAMMLVAGSFFLWSCETDPDSLGSQFFDDQTAQGTHAAFDIIAYNISNLDSLRADGRLPDLTRKDSITLGAFNEPVFGMQKSSYVSQLRLSSYSPDFGKNTKIDSIVLSLKPKYYSAEDSITTSTVDKIIWSKDSVEAKKVVKTYPIYKYGKAKMNGQNTSMTINVHEVNDFLGSSSDVVFSNKNVSQGALIGSTTFNGRIQSVEVTKNSDNTSLLSITPSIRVKLDKNFFQSKIVDKKDDISLSNLSNFIRYFKGLKISVAENDGYIMKLGIPTATDVVMYYTHDDATEAGKTKQSTFNFDLSSSNASYSLIDYNRSGTMLQNALATSNENTGDAKLFAQGMGGPSIGVKIPDQYLAQLKELYKNDKIGVISAKLRFHTDTDVWNNLLEKPKSYTAMQYKGANVYDFLTDISAFSYAPGFRLVRPYDLYKEATYYDISLTQTIKDIIEKEEENKPLVIKVGDYLASSTGAYLGQNVDNRIYTPNRIVLVGTDANNAKKAQLLVTYTKK